MRKKLTDQIMSDLRNDRDKAGKLWGALAQLPSYLDRCHDDTGNADYDYGRRFGDPLPGRVQAVGWWHGRSLTRRYVDAQGRVGAGQTAERLQTAVRGFTGLAYGQRIGRTLAIGSSARFGKKRVALLDAGGCRR